MAMTNCKECQAPISSSARICPHCGIRRKTHPIAWLIGIGLLSFFIFSWLSYQDTSAITLALSPCDSAEAERKVRELTANSKHNKFDIVIFSEPKTLRKTADLIECEAKVVLSDTREAVVTYTFFIEDGESYLKTSFRAAN